MKKNVAIIMFITVISTSLGFIREIALTYFYGASSVSDVYLVSQAIPSTIFAFIGVGLATTFIPIYNKIKKEKSENVAYDFTANLINIVILVATVIILITIVFTPKIIMIFAPGFNETTMNLTISFTRITIFGIYFSSIIYIFNSFLQIKKKFIVPALIGIPMNIVMIFSFFLASKTNDILLAYGILFSFLIQLFFILPNVFKNGFRYRLTLNFRDKYIKEILVLSVPIIIGTSVNQINGLVDKNIASTIVVGGMSALNYANILIVYIGTLCVTPIVTVIYPSISEMVVNSNHEGLKKIVNESIVIISFLLIPITIGSIILARPIIEMLFLRGQFDSIAAEMTSNSLKFYSFGLIAYAFRDIIARVFYSYNDTKTPVINAIIGVIINIVLNFILSKYMGIYGLALATSISAYITTGMLFISLRKKISGFGLKDTLIKITKITLASLIMGITVNGLFNQILSNIGRNLSIIVSVLGGVIVYVIIIATINFTEFKKYVYLIHAKIKMRNKSGN